MAWCNTKMLIILEQSVYMIRDGPFDILGGGVSGWDFLEKNFVSKQEQKNLNVFNNVKNKKFVFIQ